jgi:hypothetical protein
MTYLATYWIYSYHRFEGARASLYQKRGSFVVDGDTCEQAATNAKAVLDDAVKYGVKYLRMPADVTVDIVSVLPTTPREPTWDDIVDASRSNRRKGPTNDQAA